MIKPIEIYVNTEASRRKVKAYCVQGETGFLAFYKSGVWIHIARGDDGFWNEFYTFRINWLKEVFDTFFVFYSSIPEEEKKWMK